MEIKEEEQDLRGRMKGHGGGIGNRAGHIKNNGVAGTAVNVVEKNR